MRGSPFHRNHFENLLDGSKKVKNMRLSADLLASTPAKPTNDLKKHKRRTSNLFNGTKTKDSTAASNPKPKDTPIPIHHKHITSNTAKNSTNATRTNSPIKGSLANSQLLVPAPALIKNYKFYYQIGFGAFGRVWKVAERESGREYALKEISKNKYYSIDSECWISAM